MARQRMSRARKIKEGRGQGTGPHYKPWYDVREFDSKEYSTRDTGWKTGRIQHFRSDLEFHYFLNCEWSRLISDIREQYPLLLHETQRLAHTYRIDHPAEGSEPVDITTDFLLTVSTSAGEVLHARAVKKAVDLGDARTLDKLEIERRYWEDQGVDWGIVTEQEILKPLASNVAKYHEHYDITRFMPQDQADTIAARLTRLVQEHPHEPLRALATACDERLGYHSGHDSGTSLCVAFHLIVTRQWEIDMNTPIDPGKPLALQMVALRSRGGEGGQCRDADRQRP
jgi:TnsA endonuclease N terminal/TnsA endonuclease C terminal